MKLRIAKAKVVESSDGKPAPASDPLRELHALAYRIQNGEYGDVENIQVVVEAKGRRASVVGFGEAMRRDPVQVLWRGIEELARISDPPQKCVVAPKFAAVKGKKKSKKS